MTASLYIHVPFCAGKCDYCDFFSIPVNAEDHGDLMDSFAGAVLSDIKDLLIFFNIDNIPSLFIGGGTPSILGAARMERLLAGIQTLLQSLTIKPAEFTVEANPESADENFLRACVNGGVNRISLGVQTFHEPSRRAVHRVGNSKLLEQRLESAAAYFPGAFSIDLISGLPFQTTEVLAADIQRILALNPPHVSLYSLTLEDETPLCRQAARKGTELLSLPSGDEADDLWLMGRDLLEQAGLTQYEVSNFSLPGKTCAHNIRYWRMENWLGAGPSASGTIIDDSTGSGIRFTCPAGITAWLNMPGPRVHSAGAEKLERAELMRETLLMGFRYRGGPDPISFMNRFGCDIQDCIPQTITRWRARNFFERSSLTPSRNGLLFLDSFLRDAFAELESEKTTFNSYGQNQKGSFL